MPKERKDRPLFILHVNINVKPECLDEFMKEITWFAEECRKEPGCLRFDVLQELEDPTKFMILEAFPTDEGVVAHQQSEHYKRWGQVAPPLIVEPRIRVRYRPIVGVEG